MTYQDLKQTRPVERRVFKVNVGDVFPHDGKFYEVIEVFSHYVLCKYNSGGAKNQRECFTIGDLVMMGLEPSKPNKFNCFEVV